VKTDEYTLFVPGTLNEDGGAIESARWELKDMPRWRADRRWVLVQVGWVPVAAATDAAIFRLGAGGWETDTFALPLSGMGPTALDVWYPFPPGWDGILLWKSGGKIFRLGTFQTSTWASTVDVSVWAKFIGLPPETRC
jgi:hypothetical protein